MDPESGHSPPALVLLLLTAALFGVACQPNLPQSVGPNQEIIVLADPGDWEFLQQPLRDVFEEILYTPQEEKVFWVKLGDVTNMEASKYLLRKNVLVAAPLDAGHPTADFMRSILSPEVIESVRAPNGSAVSWKEDVWADEQLLMVVTGKDLGAVVDNIRLESDRLLRAAESGRDRRLEAFLYRVSPRQDVMDYLADTCGWSVRVPFGYRILEAYPDSGFVTLAKDNPNRWLFVYWEDGIHPDLLSDSWCIRKRDEITARLFGGDRIVPGDVQTSQVEFAGKLAYTLQGLWENEKEWKGGPFKSYAFVDMDLDRFFFIDVGLFAPNKNKEPYLRQVDLIARTFRLAPLSP